MKALEVHREAMDHYMNGLLNQQSDLKKACFHFEQAFLIELNAFEIACESEVADVLFIKENLKVIALKYFVVLFLTSLT